MLKLNRLIVLATLWVGAIFNIALASSSHTVTKTANIRHLQCKKVNFHYEQDHLLLNDSSVAKQRLFLIHNPGDDHLRLMHQASDKSVLAYKWSSQLCANRWSAIAVQGPLMISCERTMPGNHEHVGCQETLTVCELTNAHFDKQALGTYWVSVDSELPHLLQTSKKRGIHINEG